MQYLQGFVTMIQTDSSLLISTYQKSLLEEEWKFIKLTCPHIPDGESYSGMTHEIDDKRLVNVANFVSSSPKETFSAKWLAEC